MVIRAVAASRVLALLLGALVLVGLPAAPAVAASDAATITRLSDAARADAGLSALVRDSELDQVARRWAKTMADQQSMEHNPDVGDQIPSGWRRWGENVATGHPDGAAMLAGWMDSPGHRANILGEFTHIGVAFVRSGGTTWGVQVFAQYPAGARPAPAAASPSAQAPAPTTEPSTKPSEKADAKPRKPRATAKPSRSTPTASAAPTRTPKPTADATSAPTAAAAAATEPPVGGASATAATPVLSNDTVLVLTAGLVALIVLAALSAVRFRRPGDSARHRG